MNNKEMAKTFFNINISIKSQIYYYTYGKTTTKKLIERGKRLKRIIFQAISKVFFFSVS